MNDILKTFLSMSVSGSLLLLILLAVRPLYRTRVSKRWQYYIYLVVIARLLLPFAPQRSLVGAFFEQAQERFTGYGGYSHRDYLSAGSGKRNQSCAEEDGRIYCKGFEESGGEASGYFAL